MKKSIRKALMFAVTLALLGGALSACSFGGGEAEKETEEKAEDDFIEVRVEKPGRRNVAVSSNFAATVEAVRTVSI